MTVLVGGLSLFIAGMLGLGLSLVGRAAATDIRAQTAADAAALAAVAENAPHGGGQPHVVAARYAEANGGDLVRCICTAGEGAVQVKVAIGGITAEARAVMDPALVRSGVAGTAVGLDPRLAAAIETLVGESRGRVHVVSGYRSPDEQGKLWAEALAVYGSPERADDWVARPGGSMHGKGLAVDLGGDLATADRLVRSLGLPLHKPLPHEPWHYELIGARH